mgnify:CR=1 FL=1
MLNKIRTIVTEFFIMTAGLLYLQAMIFAIRGQEYTASYFEWGNLFLLAYFVRCLWIRQPNVLGQIVVVLITFVVILTLYLMLAPEVVKEPGIFVIVSVSLIAAAVKVLLGYNWRGVKKEA